jgi:DNA-directed RNA polymerase subunit RPC12/RpoP
MSTRYKCPSCGTKAVLVNSGGVYREIICDECNVEMKYDDSVATEWVAELDEHHDKYHYEIVE